MPSFRHETSGKRFFFAHIPRTAGRYVEANILGNNNQIVWDDDWEGLGIGRNVMNMYKKVELAHFHKEYYEQYLDVDGIPHFSIVRNPFDRFIGASIYLKRFYGNDIQELMEDENMFFQMLNMPLTGAVNWYRPQVDFMTEKTHIWKMEDGMGENFFSWLSGIVDLDLKWNPDIMYPMHSDEGNKLEKTDKLIDNLRILYRKDLETFYPELAA